jgi:hypothetical protein
MLGGGIAIFCHKISLMQPEKEIGTKEKRWKRSKTSPEGSETDFRRIEMGEAANGIFAVKPANASHRREIGSGANENFAPAKCDFAFHL